MGNPGRGRRSTGWISGTGDDMDDVSRTDGDVHRFRSIVDGGSGRLTIDSHLRVSREAQCNNESQHSSRTMDAATQSHFTPPDKNRIHSRTAQSAMPPRLAAYMRW
jgi:hypothetical protein